MDLREQIRQEIASAINDCIRNDTSFRSYTDAAIEAVIEVLEKQEPVAKVHIHKTGGNAGVAWSARPLNDFDSLPLLRDGDKLYALPGAQAQPSPSVPDGWKLVPKKITPHMGHAGESELDDDGSMQAIWDAMLGAAPEAKQVDELRAKIEQMERQEPVGTLYDDGCFVWRNGRPYESNYAGWKLKLYALPGAKGE